MILSGVTMRTLKAMVGTKRGKAGDDGNPQGIGGDKAGTKRGQSRDKLGTMDDLKEMMGTKQGQNGGHGNL